MPKAKSPLRIKTDEIRAWFANCDPTQTQVKDALKRAAKLIWEYQTSQEQQSGTTIDHNGVGYNGVDADFASRIVNWRGTLTNRMAMAARKMLKKYAKQLAGMRQTFSVIHAETLSRKAAWSQSFGQTDLATISRNISLDNHRFVG